MSDPLRALLLGGPPYAPLYDQLGDFTATSGIRLELTIARDHGDLNERIARDVVTGRKRYDVVSTHTRYAASQAAGLTPLRELENDLAAWAPATLEMARVGGRLLSLPRSQDVRLLHYRADLIDAAPTTCDELRTVAAAHTGAGRYGFALAGRGTGLSGLVYELTAAFGHDLFDGSDASTLCVHVDTDAARRALQLLVDLARESCDPRTPEWRDDDVTDSFCAGRTVVTADWPGAWHRYRSGPSAAAASTRTAPYPVGTNGRRACAGCHSFAIPANAKNRAGAVKLLRFLTDPASQAFEARLGSLPARVDALASVTSDAAPGSVEAVRRDQLRESASGALAPPGHERFPALEDLIWRAARRALTGDQPVVDALRSIDAAWAQTAA